MESETEVLNEEEAVEFEDIVLSDSEDTPESPLVDLSSIVNIDYNNRIVLNKTDVASCDSTDNCDTRFSNKHNANPEKNLYMNDTSSEEMELSDSENLHLEEVSLKNIPLSGMAGVSGNRHLESLQSFDYSSTTFKDECLTDAEYVSEDEADLKSNDLYVERKNRRLSFGLSVAELVSTVKDVFSSRQTTLSSISVTNPFCSNIAIKNGMLSKGSKEERSPLMTCIEFLKYDPSEDELTDIEDFAAELCDNDPANVICDLDEAIRYRGKANSDKNERKKSWTTELLYENGVSESGIKPKNKQNNHYSKRNMKRNSDTTEGSNELLTDEESFDIDSDEWTETDESGGVRQVTQIKTETSIKMAGDGDGSTYDNEDLIRSTTTTTTRIVTTVTTDDTDGQQGDGDDLRHSVEVILNQFMSDGDSSKQEEAHSGPEE